MSVNPILVSTPNASTPSASFYILTPPSLSSSASSSAQSTLPTTTGISSLSGTSLSSSTSSTSLTSVASGSPTSTFKPKPSSSSKGVSGGATAGIAIGCFIAGVLLAVAMSFVVVHSQKKKRLKSYRDLAKPSRDKSPTFERTPPTGRLGNPQRTLEDFLPQRADDVSIRKRLNALFVQIDNYVGNYYENRRIEVPTNLEASLSRYDTQDLPKPLVACLDAAERPTYLLKHCLSQYIIALTISPSVKFHTLLPSDVANTLLDVQILQHQDPDNGDVDMAFSQWKLLTAYLRPALFKEPGSVVSDLDNKCIQAAREFCQAFKPWANEEFPDNELLNELAILLNSALKLALWLLSQPDTFELLWSVPDDARDRRVRRVVTLPSVWKTTFGGSRLERPQMIAEASVRTL